MTRAEKFEVIFGVKVDTSMDCGFFDCTDKSTCDGCPVKETTDWWNGEYKDFDNMTYQERKEFLQEQMLSNWPSKEE